MSSAGLRRLLIFGACVLMLSSVATASPSVAQARTSACGPTGACGLGWFGDQANICGCTIRGSRVSITVPGTFSVHDQNINFAAVSAFGGSTGGARIEVGFGRSNNPPSTSCFTGSNGTKIFYEANPDVGGSVCTWKLGTSGTSNYKVIRTAECSTCWTPFVDNSAQSGDWNVGFNGANEVFAGPYIWDYTNDSGSVWSINFASSLSWERTADTNASPSWTVIQGANDERNEAQQWHFPNAMIQGNPFTISFVG